MEYKDLSFANTNEYSKWTELQKMEVYYTKAKRNKKLYSEIVYKCNRSDTEGYKKNYQIRTEKAGGTIKIKGICPSRYVIRTFDDGKVVVKFQATHVGHIEELRTRHLSNEEKKQIVEKLKIGVTTDRIMKDAKQENRRLSVLKRKDLANLMRKHNIERKRHTNETIATTLKVQEWNSSGKNYAFLFKQQGEKHELLKDDDFALGFMNDIMRSKLVNYAGIICMDGTHGTNKKGLDLTTILVKDNNNTGFPVAFLLSNRLDQMIQEIFLGALKNTLGEEITANYFMTDDDPKYFNAWNKIMGNTPQRLLCTWHVMKNWNIQGRSKIKDTVKRQQMKNKMKNILNETNVEIFHHKVQEYFQELQESSETDFLNYLQKYYFQDETRIKMWAHCFRTNVGVNTNMSIESLNNFLKTNLLKRQSNVSTEKLLDTLDELVNFKMWQRILKMERPDASNYQDRIVIKAHKKAEQVKNIEEIVSEVGFGEFIVTSASKADHYNIKYNELCESECRTLYCRVCKICIHRYSCNCSEYAIRTTMCKHVHLVCMYERRGVCTNSVLDDVITTVGRESQIRKEQQLEVTEFMDQRTETEEPEKISRSEKCQALTEYLIHSTSSLDDEEFNRIYNQMVECIKVGVGRKSAASAKRTMDTQKYYPSKKQRF